MLCPKCASPVLSPESAKFCALCNHPLLSDSHGANEAPPPLVGIPWEHVERRGVVKALIATLRKSLLDPQAFFGELSSSRNSYMAWLYALLLGSIGALFNFLWTYYLITPLLALLPGLDEYTGQNTVSIAGLIMTPVIISFKLVFAAFYFQVLLFLTRSNRQNTWATFRILSYTQSTAILDCIPLIGSVVAPLWSMYLLAIGLHKIHGISMAKAFMIILLPIVLLTGALLFIVLLIFGASLAAHDIAKDFFNLIRF